MGRPESSTTTQIHIHDHEQIVISTTTHLPKVWEQFVDNVYSVLKCMHFETFSTTSTIFIETLNLLRKKKVMEN